MNDQIFQRFNCKTKFLLVILDLDYIGVINCSDCNRSLLNFIESYHKIGSKIIKKMVELNREFLVKKYGEDNLINLTEIKLSGNPLNRNSKYNFKRINSNTFTGLNKLEILYLNDNQIKVIDERLFENLSNLKELDLFRNKLKRIDSNTFKRITKLEKLTLGANQIEVIDERSFESLTNLKELILYGNQPKRIDSNTFKGLTKLEQLYLNSNQIEIIDERSFESLTNLRYLSLSYNKLIEIDRKCFEPLKSIEMIEIYENEGLDVISFVKPLTVFKSLDIQLVIKSSISDWNEFLQQFPELGK